MNKEYPSELKLVLTDIAPYHGEIPAVWDVGSFFNFDDFLANFLILPQSSAGLKKIIPRQIIKGAWIL